MNVPKSIFRQYDVRGLVDRELTPELARGAGAGVCQRGVDRLGHAPVIAVGRDNRPSGSGARLKESAGVSPTPAAPPSTSGTLPTPALYFAVSALETDGGLQVTGSHNPPEFNGFKMVLAGEAFHGDDILGLWEIIVAERWRTGARPGDPRRLGARSVTARASSAATGSSGRSEWWWTAATARGA